MPTEKVMISGAVFDKYRYLKDDSYCWVKDLESKENTDEPVYVKSQSGDISRDTECSVWAKQENFEHPAY